MKWIFGTLMVAFLAALGGCGDDDPASSKTVTLTVENGLTNEGVTWDIHTIHVSPAGSAVWGDDRLGAAEILAFGATKQIDLVSGRYDLRAADEDGDCYYNVGRSLSKDFTWQVTLAGRDADCARGKRISGANEGLKRDGD